MTFNSREADTQVMVKDGETIFIGGLIYETKSKREHKVPILGDLLGWIPVVGSAVNYEEDMVDKTEVVFFVTVNLINSGIDSIKKSETQNVFRRHYPGKSEKEPLKQGKLTATQTSVQIPVDARPVEKKKAWWDFSGKK
jgi:type II secretory pathway component GspD/PulD (secretin)